MCSQLANYLLIRLSYLRGGGSTQPQVGIDEKETAKWWRLT